MFDMAYSLISQQKQIISEKYGKRILYLQVHSNNVFDYTFWTLCEGSDLRNALVHSRKIKQTAHGLSYLKKSHVFIHAPEYRLITFQ